GTGGGVRQPVGMPGAGGAPKEHRAVHRSAADDDDVAAVRLGPAVALDHHPGDARPALVGLEPDDLRVSPERHVLVRDRRPDRTDVGVRLAVEETWESVEP